MTTILTIIIYLCIFYFLALSIYSWHNYSEDLRKESEAKRRMRARWLEKEETNHEWWVKIAQEFPEKLKYCDNRFDDCKKMYEMLKNRAEEIKAEETKRAVHKLINK